MALTNHKHITHVIFDVDGLLLDTERLYTRIMDKLCGEHGKKFSWDLKVKLMGKKQSEAARIFIDELSLPITVDEYCLKVNQMIRESFPDAELMPGAARLVRHLHRHNIPMCLATGSHKEELALKISKHEDLFSCFLHTVCSSTDPDVKLGKPAPDCFLVAAARFPGGPPALDNILVFEDAPNGVVGALAAGMHVVWVPDPLCPIVDTTLGVNSRVYSLKTLNDFVPEQFGLPCYSDNQDL